MAVSQKAIAQHLGVSQALVGMALNGHPRISPATSERIKKAAEELGYDAQLNQGARQMVARRYGLHIPNDVIAVCCSQEGTLLHQRPFESELLNGIESRAAENNIDILQCRLREGSLPRLIEKKEVDGIIVISSKEAHLAALQKLGLPIVSFFTTGPAVHSVTVQQREGIRLATAHLIELGHRKIGFIGQEVSLSAEEFGLVEAAQQRLAGFKEAMKRAKLPVEYVESSLRESFPSCGKAAFHKLYEYSGHSLTAVVCYNDSLAMGVTQAARELGLDVPRDLSVVGFDNMSEAFGFEPRIASVNFDRIEMGARAFDILMRAPHNSENSTEIFHEEMPVNFMAGETTAPPRL